MSARILDSLKPRHRYSENGAAELLHAIFRPDYYRRAAGLGDDVDAAAALDHFLRVGMQKGISPGPLFDFAEVERQLRGSHRLNGPEDASPSLERLFDLWITLEEPVSSTPLFDGEFYLERHADLAADSSINPFAHFIMYGQFEGRAPCRGLVPLADLLPTIARRREFALADMIGRFPDEGLAALMDSALWTCLRECVQTEFYKAQTDEDVGETADEVLVHYLTVGMLQEIRPTYFFNEDFYGDIIRLEQKKGASIEVPCKGVPAFLHWLSVGRALRIVPTPLFNIEYYLLRNADLSQSDGWLFEHFLLYGSKEGRAWSFLFDEDYFLGQVSDCAARSSIPVIDWVIRGRQEGIQPAPDVFVRREKSGDLRRTTSLEAIAHKLAVKAAQLSLPELNELIEKAAAIEPMVVRPYGYREFRSVALRSPALHRDAAAESARHALEHSRYDTIVLAPHVRLSGAAFVTGQLMHSLVRTFPDERQLLLTTDLSEFQRPEWFPAGIERLDLAAHCAGLDFEAAVHVLLDMVRGLKPKRVVNVNSRLAWGLFEAYGRQISMRTDLFAYLFCADIDEHGHLGGYPVYQFQTCFDSLSGVLLDNTSMKADLESRYAMSAPVSARLQVAHTPADRSPESNANNFAVRRQRGEPLRAFWAGRFDRQKRFDVAVEIARKMPELEIHAWGASVLDKGTLDRGDLPFNVRLQGTFGSIEELPIESFDFFLYTSEWDGLPTILISLGARGVPCVASRVGGVADLISDETGWPVDDVLNADAYVSAVRAMCEQPEAVTKRAAALKDHTRALCNADSYDRTLAAVFATGRLARQ